MKSKSVYSCHACGGESLKWQGQCPHCQAWNSLTEIPLPSTTHRYVGLAQTDTIQSLGEVNAQVTPRFSSGITEFDRVLGGGLIPGGVVLIGGDPGIGKSTLLLQAVIHLTLSETQPILYVSGEESAQQIALRAKRLKLNSQSVQLLAEIRLEAIQSILISLKPKLVVIDSIQTLYSEMLSPAPGSVSQVRECAAQLTRIAKQNGITVILVGHVTKEGSLAGPRVLEHIVDTVLYFEGDAHSSFRLIRSFKNRFGAVNELGVFAMTENGLSEVLNPSALFLSHHDIEVPGSCVMVTQEGTRPLLIEIQALVDETQVPNPRRLSVGLEQNRLAMLLAVLHRHAGIAAFNQDVFINAVGGVKITEPGADLPTLLAIVSSLKNKPLSRKLVAFGEIGLAGEVRAVQRGEARLKEAVKLGFTQALIPKINAPNLPIEGLTIITVERIAEAVKLIF